MVASVGQALWRVRDDLLNEENFRERLKMKIRSNFVARMFWNEIKNEKSITFIHHRLALPKTISDC